MSELTAKSGYDQRSDSSLFQLLITADKNKNQAKLNFKVKT